MSVIPPPGNDLGLESSGLIDPAQEVELWWGGYAGRTMVPAFLLCALTSAAVLLIAQLVWREESVPASLVWHLALYVIVLVWAVGLTRWAYRTVTLAYRLTNRRLLREQGFSHPAPPPIELVSIREVRVEQRAWERWVGVGRVLVESADGSTAILPGVLDPQRLAAALLRQAEECRANSK